MSRSEPNTALLRRALGEARPPSTVEQRIVAGAMARLDAGPRKSRWRFVVGSTALSATALAGVLFVVSTPVGPESSSGCTRMICDGPTHLIPAPKGCACWVVE